MNSLTEALKQFEATEANLAKLEALWKEIEHMIPGDVCFGDSTDGTYDDRCRAFTDVHAGLPMIDAWSMPVSLMSLNDIGRMRFDAMEVGDIESKVAVEECISEQDKHIREYRHRFNKKRRQLVRSKVLEIIDRVDATLRELSTTYPDGYEKTTEMLVCPAWSLLKEQIATIDTLLGGSFQRPIRWDYLQRHLHFSMVADLADIRNSDWPSVKAGLARALYGESDPLPVSVPDLGALVDSNPSGEIASSLKWSAIDDSEFERLLFCLISQADGYENPEWLTKTEAPDRGRDLSVTRVYIDRLGGTIRQRVIIQCKHWQSRSVALTDVTAAKDQMKLWEPPRIDLLIVAISGRFTTDAIQWVERHNQSDSGLRIEMWPESHLERLLASRPGLIAEFRLR